MLYALLNGAEKLDCYGKTLAQIYMKYGFLPVARMKFSREINSDFPQKYGEPDVIAMYNSIQDLGELVQRQENDSLKQFDDIVESLPYFEDYDAMLEYRDKILQETKNQNLSYNEAVERIVDIGDYKE